MTYERSLIKASFIFSWSYLSLAFLSSLEALGLKSILIA
jgi:hypothetical protein